RNVDRATPSPRRPPPEHGRYPRPARPPGRTGDRRRAADGRGRRLQRLSLVSWLSAAPLDNTDRSVYCQRHEQTERSVLGCPYTGAAFRLARREAVRSFDMGYALSGKTALVTGANRGIGEALVDALVAAGVNKVYAAARNISALAPLVERHGSRIVPLQLDVTNAAQIAAVAATATDVDLLVNNAGIVGFFGGDFTDPKWIECGRQEMEVNFLGTFAVTQAFAPVLAKNGGGAIANLNSVASFVSF